MIDERQHRFHPGAANKPHLRPHRGNRLLFGVPLTEHLFSAYFRKWLDLNINPYNVITIGGIYLADAHNKMVEIALERRDWDALVWLEHDHEFPVDLVERMSSYPADVDIVGGLYFGRNVESPFPMAGMWAESPERPYGLRYLKPSEVLPMLQAPGLYPVDFVPSGCTFIRRRVFEEWKPRPWYHVIAAGVEDMDGAGDDVRFAKLAGAQGFKIRLDSALDVKHLSTYPLGRDWYLERLRLQHYERLIAELQENGVLAEVPF